MECTYKAIDRDYYKQKNNNMETKKRINWLKIWQIIRDLLVAILTGDAIANKI